MMSQSRGGFQRRSRSELVTTDTELMAMAAPAKAVDVAAVARHAEARQLHIAGFIGHSLGCAGIGARWVGRQHRRMLTEDSSS